MSHQTTPIYSARYTNLVTLHWFLECEQISIIFVRAISLCWHCSKEINQKRSKNTSILLWNEGKIETSIEYTVQ